MAMPIEDYALLSDSRTAALVSRLGSVDWFCPPRFDAPSVFGALLGDEEHGHWGLRPGDPGARASRSYLDGTFVLVTRWETDSGVVEVLDAMPVDGESTHIIRRVRGVSGTVRMATQVRLRFDYARTLPWVRQSGTAESPALTAIGGPDAVVIRGIGLQAHDRMHTAEFTVGAGEVRDLTLSWFASYHVAPAPLDVEGLLRDTVDWWRAWAERLTATGPYDAVVARSLLVLRALSHRDTGGVVAAATTSLPEELGGERNWDYRYVWLRDSALTMGAFVRHGHLALAQHWRTWLLRAIAGDPADVQIMYGLAGERELPEAVLTSLPGYEGSAPVRIGNGAVDQFQADVFGEVIVAFADARDAGLAETPESWALQHALVRHVVSVADRLDQGLWEIRGEPQAFTHSRVMLWAALDRAVQAVERYHLRGEVGLWTELRDRLRQEIETRGVTADGHFSQYFGTDEVDAALLMLPMVGFCAPDDPRMLATVARLEEDLLVDGLLLRYRTSTGVDGLSGADNPFLACSFWLVEQYARSGRASDAEALMERLCSLANDVGLLSEEYDVTAKRQVGNTPQAFSHLALVRAADALQDLLA